MINYYSIFLIGVDGNWFLYIDCFNVVFIILLVVGYVAYVLGLVNVLKVYCFLLKFDIKV